MGNELANKVKKWMDKQGYPFELKVARIFRTAGFEVAVGTFADDLKQGDPREIDVTAFISAFVIPGHLLRLLYAVECKYVAAPYVVIRSSDASDPHWGMSLHSRYGSDCGLKILAQIARKEPDIFSFPPRLAHSVIEAFHGKIPELKREKLDSDESKREGNRQNRAYGAMAKICAASAGLAQMCDDRGWSEVVFPVIALRGPLLECTLTQEGSLEVAPIDRATVLWKRPLAGFQSALVDIVTEPALETYVSERLKDCTRAMRLVEAGLPEVAAELALRSISKE